MEPVEGDPAQPPWLDFLLRRGQWQADSFYTNAHSCDALNPFVALIDIMSNSGQPFCLNRIGSNPLGTFSDLHIKCRDVQRMGNLINGFASDLTGGVARHIWEIATCSRRRCSVGVDCLPLPTPTDVRQSVSLRGKMVFRSLREHRTVSASYAL
jgi:hypothetical protein